MRIQSIAGVQYESAIQRLFSGSPYFIKTTRFMDINKPDEGLSFFSGIDTESILILMNIFENLTFLSASFTPEHKILFDWLNISITFEEMPAPSFQKDRGVILIKNISITPQELFKLSKIGNLLHFSTSKKKAGNLEMKCNRISEIRPHVAVFDHIYRKEYVRSTMSHFSTEVGQKRINLSYVGSTLSTGVDLPEFNLSSVDLPHHIPFVFIPESFIKDSKEIKRYISEQISTKIIQALSRVCRNKEQFKILVLNRFQIKYKDGEDTIVLRHDVLKNISFQNKFENFKRYELKTTITRDLVDLLQFLLLSEESLSSAFLHTTLEDDMLSFLNRNLKTPVAYSSSIKFTKTIQKMDSPLSNVNWDLYSQEKIWVCIFASIIGHTILITLKTLTGEIYLRQMY